VRVFAIWEPILPTDWERPGAGVLSRLSDRRVAQFWDKQHLFSAELQRKLSSDAGHPRPSCCEQDGDLWDMVALYPGGARWDGSLPRAVFLDGPVMQATGLSKALGELLHSSGRGTSLAPTELSRTD
jgi:hypothetical protein